METLRGTMLTLVRRATRLWTLRRSWDADDWLNAGTTAETGTTPADVITEVRNLVAMLNNELLLREWDEGMTGVGWR